MTRDVARPTIDPLSSPANPLFNFRVVKGFGPESSSSVMVPQNLGQNLFRCPSRNSRGYNDLASPSPLSLLSWRVSEYADPADDAAADVEILFGRLGTAEFTGGTSRPFGGAGIECSSL